MIPNLVKEALEAGVQLYVENGGLKFAVRKGGFPAELREKIVRHKAEIVAFLARVDGAGEQIQQAPLQQVADRTAISLSFSQQRLWFVDQLEGGSHQYNISAALRLTGVLDTSALQRAFDEIVSRHEVLRTLYRSSEGGDGVQVPQPPRAIQTTYSDVSSLETEEQERRVLELARLDAETPFDLRGDILLRAGLVKLRHDEHVLLFTMHHIASDGWSIGILVNEFSRLYVAFSEGRPSPLAPLTIQYADYAAWQRSMLQGDELNRQIDYWTNRLDGIPRLHSLPIDKQRPAQQQFAGRRLSQSLDRALLDDLRNLASANGTTLFVLLQSAFSLLVGRWSNESDVVIGSPVAGRIHKDVEQLIGCFVNTLTLRTTLAPELTFKELLARSKETVLEAFSHQQVPFEMLVDAVKPERSLSHSPLFQLLFVLQNNDHGTLDLPGLAIRQVDGIDGIIRYDLELSCTEGDAGLMITWSYADALFEQPTIARLAESFAALLRSIVAAPETNIHALSIVAERDVTDYAKWNQTATAFPADRTIHQLFEEQAAAHPDAVALVCDGHELTYARLNEKANQLADYLREYGLGPDSMVGICVERSFEMVVAVLGVLKAGAAYVPLEPSYPRERIEYIVRDAALEVVLVESSVIQRLPLSGVDVVLVDEVLGDELLDGYSTANLEDVAVTPEHLAYVIYTSGSTGQPKGAMVHHRGVVNYLTHAVSTYFEPHHVGAVMSSPLCFDATVTTLLAPLVAGRRLVLLPEAQEELIAGLTRYLFEDEAAWLFKITPAHLELLGHRAGTSCTKEHAIVVGGEQLTVSTLAQWKEQLLPNATFFNEYGPTETVVGCSIHRVHTASDIALRGCAGAVPIGKPIQNTTLHVLNARRERVPVGAIGELYIGGSGVAHGYLNRAELTAERFIDNPFGEGRLYKTGDVVRWLPDGNLVFLGRSDDQVKIRGFRIELGEIAAKITAFAEVKESLVVAVEDEEEKSLVAYVVSDSDEDVLVESLRRSLTLALPDYMVPSAFVVLPAFPLTTNGKIDRKALPAPNRQSNQTYVAPSTPTELTLAELWQETLKLDGAVSVTANFFHLGGHSLMATRLLSRVAKELSIGVPLRALFEHPTLRDFAAHLDTLRKVTFVPLAPVSRDRELPPSFAQQRLWFIDQLEEGSAQYNMPAALHLKGALDLAALQQTLDAIVARHEVLRTRFVAKGDSCIQDIQPALPVPMRVLDATHAELESIARDEVTRLFDLSSDLMLRVTLVRLGADEHALLLTLHHIASDGWSLGLLVKEFSALYAAFSEGRANPLAPLQIQYADYAHWQRALLSGEAYDRQLAYWSDQLADLPPVHSLPLDKPRPAQQSFAGGNHTTVLDAPTLARLNALAEGQSATLFMVLQSAFALLLGRWSHASDVVMGSPISGRNHKDVEPLIGFFVNTLVLRTQLAESMTFEELLRRNKQTVLDAFTNQDVPFDGLVGELKPARSLSYSPLFQILFALQNNDAPDLQLPNLAVTPLGAGNSAIRFDLQLAASEKADGLMLSWSFAESLFDVRTIERMAASFEVLLRAIAENAADDVHRLPLLTGADQLQLAQWNETAADVPATTVHALFEAQAAKSPDAIAVVDRNEQFTYRELNERANQIAHDLIARGAKPGTLVGISVDPNASMIAGLLGILKSGAAYVPLSKTLPEARLQYMLEDAAIDLVLENTTPAEQRATSNPNVASDVAYVIYTSGTTGQPKGVTISHAAAVNFTTGFLSRLEIAEAGKWLLLTGITFDIAFFEWFGCLAAGGTCSVADAATQTDAAELRSLLEREQFQLVQTTPSRWSQLLDAGWRGQRGLYALCGGEALPLVLQERLAAITGSLWNCYGPTEATVWSLINKVETNQSVVALGRGLANYRHHVLSANQEMAAIGAIGELYIGGPSLANGYLNRAELTAERFATIRGERLYRTGDLVRYLPDGNLTFIGRTDDQVKVRGYRIELGEIEAQLRRIANVREAAVAARGEAGDKYLAAYIVGEATVDELRAALQQTLPDYMIPTAFVTMSALPLNANGKVDRKALPEPERQAATYVAPETETEARIAELWQQILKLDAPVSVLANFFDLGGHSLIATRIASAVSEALGKTMPVRALFEHNTVRALAAHLDRQNVTVHAAIPVVDRTGDLPLSFAQQRLWFIDQLAGGSAQYNMPAALRLTGKLDLAALEHAFDTIVARHEVLRTRFIARDEAAVQEIVPPCAVTIGEMDLSDLDEAPRMAFLERLVREQATHPFDLSRDLMLRVAVVRLAPRDHALLITLHHIAADGWSVEVLVNEFAALYRAYTEGQADPLPPLAIQYADFAQWQREQLQGDAFERQVDYWRTQLAGIPRVHSLPLDKPRPAQQRYEGASVVRTIDAELVDKLNSLARRHRASLFMVLESAFALLVGRWSRAEDVVIGSPIAGREHRALDPLIGFFVNTLVLRTHLSATMSFEELLAQTTQTALDAFANQAVPFETLVDELKPERGLSHGALFQILFSLAHRERGMAASLPELEVTSLGHDASLTKFDLSLTAIEGDVMTMRWQYATSLFDATTIERMAASFEVLLRAIVETPHRAVSALPLVSATDRETFLSWNGPVVDRTNVPAVHHAFEAQVERTPDAIAIQHGDRTLMYRELNAQANRLAHELIARSIPSGARVGLYFDRSPEVLIGMLGILKAGATYVPFEPGNTAERLRHIVQNGEIACVVADSRIVHRLPENVDLVLLDDEQYLARFADHNPNVAAAESAYVMYTSGSTGAPKGVEILQSGLADYCAFASDRYYAEHLGGSFVVTSHGFDITVPSLYVPLLRGGRVQLSTRGEELIALAAALTADDCAWLLRMTPMHVSGLLSLVSGAFESRHVFVIGGEAFPASLARELQARFPSAQIFNHYGPTETVVGCAMYDVTANLADAGERLPIGRAMANTELYVLNEAMELNPVGVAGELHIGGAGVAKGYVNQPDVTAQKFVQFGDSRVYKSGDLVRWLPTGDLEFLGRADDQLKIRGFRIEPGEIESVLKTVVRDALVTVQGEGEDKALVAYVVGDASIDSLKERLKKALPDYMVPSAWCVLDAFPLNANGKIDRKALPAVERQAAAQYVAPEGETEVRLAELWQDILKLRTPVGVTANFFELGGHSLLATRLASQIAVAFQCRVPIQAFFQHQDIRSLAGFIDGMSLMAGHTASHEAADHYEDEGTL